MRIDENQIHKIYDASQSKSANFKNLNYSERSIVEKALKAFKTNPDNPKSFNVNILGNVNVDQLIDSIEGKGSIKRISFIRKKFARILGAKSSEKLAALAKATPKKGQPVDAKEVFNALGKNWWKQIFDGQYHKWGAKVFDKGLHKRRIKEPGFYQSALNAFNFASEHLSEPLTVDFYCSLHQKACAHFQGRANSTLMKAEDAGKFRECRVGTNFSVYYLLQFYLNEHPSKYDDRALKEYGRLGVFGRDEIERKMNIETALKENIECHKKYPRTKWPKYHYSSNVYVELDEIFYKKILDPLKSYIDSQKESNLGHFLPTLNLEYINSTTSLEFTYAKVDNFNTAASAYFAKFNEYIAEINHQIQSGEDKGPLMEKKLQEIAALYQKLEWCHPFKDGQGRTDLILLSKLLTENGFTPAILNEPYMSTFSSLTDWCEYLKKGMASWESYRKETHKLSGNQAW